MRSPSHYFMILLYIHIYTNQWYGSMFKLLTSVLPPKDEHDGHKNLIYLYIELELIFFLRICKTSSISIDSSQHVSHILNHEFTWNDMFQKLNSACHLNLSIILRIRKSIKILTKRSLCGMWTCIEYDDSKYKVVTFLNMCNEEWKKIVLAFQNLFYPRPVYNILLIWKYLNMWFEDEIHKVLINEYESMHRILKSNLR